ncbi:hypothetical protein RA274_27725, partial [Pseudomonas syringae pv. tagetis]|uniref:hypothetical protein n=1 Tax=Pseudomonas syringae group genomosp. 7 TaxID=251699 RepID=UPI00376F9425
MDEGGGRLFEIYGGGGSPKAAVVGGVGCVVGVVLGGVCGCGVFGGGWVVGGGGFFVFVGCCCLGWGVPLLTLSAYYVPGWGFIFFWLGSKIAARKKNPLHVAGYI